MDLHVHTPLVPTRRASDLVSGQYIIAQLLPRVGIESRLIDGTDLGAWEEALAPGAQAVFLETPSNPTLEVIDIQAVSDLAHAAGAKVIVDNVFATPVLQRPLEIGRASCRERVCQYV